MKATLVALLLLPAATSSAWTMREYIDLKQQGPAGNEKLNSTGSRHHGSWMAGNRNGKESGTEERSFYVRLSPKHKQPPKFSSIRFVHPELELAHNLKGPAKPQIDLFSDRIVKHQAFWQK